MRQVLILWACIPTDEFTYLSRKKRQIRLPIPSILPDFSSLETKFVTIPADEKSETSVFFWRRVRISSGVKDYFWAIALPGFHRARQLRMIIERKKEPREGGSDFKWGRGEDGIKERGVNSGPRTVQTAYTFSFVLKHGRTQREIMSPWLLASVEFTTLSAIRHAPPSPTLHPAPSSLNQLQERGLKRCLRESQMHYQLYLLKYAILDSLLSRSLLPLLCLFS